MCERFFVKATTIGFAKSRGIEAANPSFDTEITTTVSVTWTLTSEAFLGFFADFAAFFAFFTGLAAFFDFAGMGKLLPLEMRHVSARKWDVAQLFVLGKYRLAAFAFAIAAASAVAPLSAAVAAMPDARAAGGRLCATRDGAPPRATLLVSDTGIAQPARPLAIEIADALWVAVDRQGADGVFVLRGEAGGVAGNLTRTGDSWTATISLDDADCRLVASSFEWRRDGNQIRASREQDVSVALRATAQLRNAVDLRARDDVEGARNAFADLDPRKMSSPALALRILLEQEQHAIEREEYDRASGMAEAARLLVAGNQTLPPGLVLYFRHVDARIRYPVGDDASLLVERTTLAGEMEPLLGLGHDDVLANAIEWSVVESSIRLRDAQTRLAGTFAEVVSRHRPVEPLRRRAISMRAALLVETDDPTAAIELLRNEHDALTKSTSARGLALAQVLRRWGHASVAAQRPLDALPLLREATMMYEPMLGPDNGLTLDSRDLYALALARLGRYGEAIAIQRGLVDAYAARLSATDPLLANTQHNLAVWLIRQGRPREALPILTKLLEEQSAGGDADRPVEAWIEIGAARAALGDGAAACIAAREAVSWAGKPAVSDESRQNARFADALCTARGGRFDESIAVLETVLAARSARNGSTSRNALNTRAALARVYLDAGRANDARRELEALAAATEILREREMPDSALGRTGFSAYTESTPTRAGIRDLAFIDAREGRVRDAIARAESARARSVTDAFGWRVALAAMSQRDQVRAVALAAQQRSLDARIALLPAAARERVALESERSALAVQVAALRARAAASTAPVADFEQWRKALPQGAAFLGVQTVHGGAWAFVLRRDRPAAIVMLPSAAALVPALSALRIAWSEPSAPLARIWKRSDGTFVNALVAPDAGATEIPAGELAAAISRAFVAPLAAHLAGTTRIVIAADGAAAGLAWDALELDGAPLASRFEISRAPSLTAAMTGQRPAERRSPHRRYDLIVIGAPPYDLARPAADDGTPMGGRQWAPLPGAAAEIATVAAAYPPLRRRIVAGAEATKARFDTMARAGEFANAGVVHVAAHGYLDPDQPQWSSLVLGDGRGGAAYVTAAELATYELGADLVVLSACETALGKDVAGEGLFGLPYALSVAGARATLLTLWPVSDDSAGTFMTRFHAKLARGIAPVVALTQTKREFMRIAKYSAPFHWAPYVLIGG